MILLGIGLLVGFVAGLVVMTFVIGHSVHLPW